jgi:hypothetical protein
MEVRNPMDIEFGREICGDLGRGSKTGLFG